MRSRLVRKVTEPIGLGAKEANTLYNGGLQYGNVNYQNKRNTPNETDMTSSFEELEQVLQTNNMCFLNINNKTKLFPELSVLSVVIM